MLEAKDIRFKRHDWILRGISLKLNKGEVIALIGPNGSGKTTLAMILAGLWKPTRGIVKADGKHPKGRVYLAFQDARTIDISVKEFLELISDDLDLLPRLNIKEVLNKNAKRLSLGWKKRLHLQAAYSSRHPYVILDEPESGIDDLGAVIRTIEALRRRKGVLIITHEPEIYKSADRVLRLYSGRLLEYEEDHRGKDVL